MKRAITDPKSVMRHSVLKKDFAGAMVTLINKKRMCGTMWLISSDNKIHILFILLATLQEGTL